MRRTLRVRLALVYSGLFFVSGVLLLAIVVALFKGGSSQSAPAPDEPLPRSSGAEQPVSTDLHVLLISSGIGLAVTVVASFALGWVVAGRALQPLRAMVTTAREISASNLHSRIGLDSPYQEFKELGATLDDLFSRLEAAFQSQRHFVANASHELRTPLTAERALLQVTLADPHASAQTLRSTCEELLTLGATQERLIASLLTLATSEQGVENWEPLDVGVITAEMILTRRAEAQRRDIRFDTALMEAPAAGDPRLVESLVANLIDNAIRHNVPGGHVDIATTASTDGGNLTVRNTGPMIPPSDVDRLFLPFQRLHAERIGHPDGNGLGLAIVQAIATAHGATLTARAQNSGGLDVTVAFPLGRPARLQP